MNKYCKISLHNPSTCRHKDRTAYLEYRRKKWAAGVIAISWIMNVKMSKVKKQLKISRKNELDAFRRRAKVTGVWLIDSHQNMTAVGIYQCPIIVYHNHVHHLGNVWRIKKFLLESNDLFYWNMLQVDYWEIFSDKTLWSSLTWLGSCSFLVSCMLWEYSKSKSDNIACGIFKKIRLKLKAITILEPDIYWRKNACVPFKFTSCCWIWRFSHLMLPFTDIAEVLGSYPAISACSHPSPLPGILSEDPFNHRWF